MRERERETEREKGSEGNCGVHTHAYYIYNCGVHTHAYYIYYNTYISDANVYYK